MYYMLLFPRTTFAHLQAKALRTLQIIMFCEARQSWVAPGLKPLD